MHCCSFVANHQSVIISYISTNTTQRKWFVTEINDILIADKGDGLHFFEINLTGAVILKHKTCTLSLFEREKNTSICSNLGFLDKLLFYCKINYNLFSLSNSSKRYQFDLDVLQKNCNARITQYYLFHLFSSSFTTFA